MMRQRQKCLVTMRQSVLVDDDTEDRKWFSDDETEDRSVSDDETEDRKRLGG